MLVDSWLEFAGGAVVVAGGVAVESVVEVPDALPVEGAAEAGAESAGDAAGGGNALALPGVMVSTVAVLPMLEPVATAGMLGCNVNPMVSSPDSLAGVMVGSPLRAAAETSGPVFRRPAIDRLTNPSRLADCSFCIRAIAVGSAGGTGMPNFTSLFFASPAREDSG